MEANMKLIFALPLLAAFALASDESDTVLARTKERILDRAKQLPNYTCIETVDRSYYVPQERPRVDLPCNQRRPEKLLLQAADRLRLEIKVSDGGEIGSWPGATQFDSRDIMQLAGGGAFGTGPLGTLLVDVFGNPGVTFTFQREEDKLFAFQFVVPLSTSHYYIQAWGNWKPVAYDGTAWIDPATFDLRRIRVRTQELPPETEACYSTSSVEYEHTHLGSSDFLAPLRSTLHFFMRDGTENETSTAYSQCHEFHVESTLHFDDRVESPAETKPEAPRPPLPAGLAIALAFSSPIDSSSAAAGDVVPATTRKAVVDPKSSQVLIPAGAAVEARITSMRQGKLSPGYVLIALLLERFQTGGAWTPLFAALDVKDQVENDRRMLALRGANIALPTGQRANTALLFFPASKNGHVVPRGFQSNWVTTAPAKR